MRQGVDDGVGKIHSASGARVDILVNNAGITRDAQLIKWKDGAWPAR